eukprot:2982085-Rhodomonas_salina.1
MLYNSEYSPLKVRGFSISPSKAGVSLVHVRPAALRALCVAMGVMPTPAPVLVRGLMLKCLCPPPNPNFDLSLSRVAAAGSKCTTLPGVISPCLSGAGIGA